jgi:hypothetical protein
MSYEDIPEIDGPLQPNEELDGPTKAQEERMRARAKAQLEVLQTRADKQERARAEREANTVRIYFSDYSFEIPPDDQPLVNGCDCAAEMSDDEALAIYHALGEYLVKKGLEK